VIEVSLCSSYKIDNAYIAAPGTPEAMIAVSKWALALHGEIRRRGWHFEVEVGEISRTSFCVV